MLRNGVAQCSGMGWRNAPEWGGDFIGIPTEVYFPLTKTLSLAMLCRSHEETFQDVFKKIGLLNAIIPDFEQQLPVDMEWIENHKKGYNEGTAIPMMAQNVINHNSLQVKWSSRYIFSSKNNFILVREMIAADPNFKKGIKIKTS